MRRAALLAMAAALEAAACTPRRAIELQFTASQPSELDAIKRVEVEVHETAACRCADLDEKAGCTAAAAVALGALVPGADRSTLDSLPSGALTVRVRALDGAGAAVPLRVDCWCAADTPESVLVYSLGSPRDPAGRGCAP